MKRTPSLLSLYKTSYERRRASAAENTRVPASQGSQSESIIQETETIAIQETQAAVSQKRRTVPTIQETQTTASKKGREVTSSQVSHKRGTHLMCSKTSLFDNDNGNSNGRDDDDDDEEEEPWQPIDADPANFNNLIRLYKMKDIVVEDVFTLDQFDYLKKDKTYGIIVAYHNPIINPPAAQFSDSNADELFFRVNRHVNASATQSLVTILANSDIQLGNALKAYIRNGNTRENDGFLKRIQESFPVLPEADLNPDEEKQDVSYLTGDFYHYVVYISYDGYIWELDCWKIYPLRHDAVPKNGNWITILKKMLKVEIGVNSFNTTFLTVMEDPKVDLRNKYSVIHSFHKRITDQLARNGGTVLSQLHLNRVQTSLISYLGNKIDTDLREATLELLNEYKLGSKNEETHQAPPTQAKQVRRAGKRKVKTIRRAGKGRGKNIRFRGKGGSQAGRGATGRGQSGAASTTTSRKRQRDTGDDTDEKRKQSVRNVYSL